ncbi:MAG: prepilin-type N-terminal cleavage/methylation domain-containing protein [Muribaculaceae bacterium]|nr:prepilin-type N-terminal cleavage/methylation domain-containing protein [Muribaculaceae bacterium]
MRKGFTLSEVLITLGIIGIIAALIIPNLMTKIKNSRTEAILKEDFSILQQMMISANDNGAVNAPAGTNQMKIIKEWFSTYFLPYIKVAAVCYDEPGCWAIGKVKTKNNVPYERSYNGCGQATISFILNNGSYVCMDDFDKTTLFNNYGIKTSARYTYIFMIDTNGSKQPNIIGEDIFILGFKEETGNIVTAGYDRTIDEVKENCKSGSGYWCSTMIKNNGWKIP